MQPNPLAERLILLRRRVPAVATARRPHPLAERLSLLRRRSGGAPVARRPNPLAERLALLRRPVVAPLPPTFWAALEAYLTTAPTLSTLTDAYFSATPLASIAATPTGWNPPFLVFAAEPEAYVRGDSQSYRVKVKVSFRVQDTRSLAAEGLGRAAYAALMPQANGSRRAPLTATDGVELWAFPGLPSPASRSGMMWQGKQLWAFSFDYTFLVNRSR